MPLEGEEINEIGCGAAMFFVGVDGSSTLTLTPSIPEQLVEMKNGLCFEMFTRG